MTDTMTFQNIDLSSWGTLYIPFLSDTLAIEGLLNTIVRPNSMLINLHDHCKSV
jgi:hypothetical protein